MIRGHEWENRVETCWQALEQSNHVVEGLHVESGNIRHCIVSRSRHLALSEVSLMVHHSIESNRNDIHTSHSFSRITQSPKRNQYRGAKYSALNSPRMFLSGSCSHHLHFAHDFSLINTIHQVRQNLKIGDAHDHAEDEANRRRVKFTAHRIVVARLLRRN
jgi:hypothetical protein